MKKLILKACCCLAILQGTFAVKAQTNLSLVTFNETNATHAVVGSTIQQGALFNQYFNVTSAFAALSPVAALSPENNWYTYVGTIGNSSPNLYTLNLANGAVLYTAPATFVNSQGVTLYNNYHYADVISALVGIYTDSTSSSIRSCNIQTGALINLKTIKKANNYVSTYSHVSETFFFISAKDSFLYSYKPGTGAFDSLDLKLIDGSYEHRAIYDIQYDDLNGVLYTLTRRESAWGSEGMAVSTVNSSTGILTNVNYTVLTGTSVGASYQWALHAQNNKYLYPFTNSSNPSVYSLRVADLTVATGANNGTTFNMSGGFGILPQGLQLTNFQYNYLTGQIFGLKYVDSLVMFPTADQPLCVVTADPTGTHNVVIWEKADNGTADSFYVYRETATNVYTHIGSVHGDSLSEYHDYTGNPGSTSYRYKVAVLDGLNHVGELSDYHNTIHVQYLGGGNISWNQYTINGGTPVSSYDVLCDSLANGNWYVMLSTTGNQTSATDVNHANHTGALYRVVANLPFTCTPGRSTNQAFSNIIAQQGTGINAVEETSFGIYPNPANTLVTINTANEWNGGTAFITDVAGRKILSAPLNNAITTISTENMPAGFYTITLTSAQKGTASKALLINK